VAPHGSACKVSVTLHGFGFHPGLQVSVGGPPVRSFASAQDLQAAIPPRSLDGMASIAVYDSANGGSRSMIEALTYGAAATDLLLLPARFGAIRHRWGGSLPTRFAREWWKPMEQPPSTERRSAGARPMEPACRFVAVLRVVGV